ncbi:MAG: hypothetical protein GXO85_00700, partial [Chlorobi bacterium]|nr:hypothetical protein [Chlorobiota bacterium]
FNEELDGLDELEKSYLYKIASRLPADYNELLRFFDEDPLLPKILDNLTKQKLIRLSGSTYDTYNDVFKEYLVYNKLPEFKNTIIYRQFPNPILMAFHTWVIKKRKFTIEEFTKENGISKGSAFNQLRELTNINTITKKGVNWIVPKQVVDIYDQGRLGEFLRQQLIANDVVSKFVNRISSESKIDKLFVLHFLKSEYAFIEANEKSWEYYVNVFLAWLSSSLLITIDKDGYIFRNNNAHDEIVKLLGNMKDSTTYRKRATSNVFLPSAPFKQALTFYKLLIDGKTLNTGAFKKSIGDFKYLNIISSSQDLLVNSVSEFEKVSSVALSVNDFDDLWNEIRSNGNVISTFKRDINDSMKDSTMLWRIKTLISWGKGLNIIPNKRYQYKKNT